MDLNSLVKKIEKNYFNNFEDDYYDFYKEYVRCADELYLPINTKKSFDNFCNFIISHSSHKKDYIDEEVNKYLEEYNRQQNNEDLDVEDNYDDYGNY